MLKTKRISEIESLFRWEKASRNGYVLFDGTQRILELKLGIFHTSASITKDGKVFQLKRTGFMGMGTTIQDEFGQLLLEVQNGSWWKFSRNVIAGKESVSVSRKYQPHQSCCISQYGQDILIYSHILQKRRLQLVISSNRSAHENDWLFHVLLLLTNRSFQYV